MASTPRFIYWSWLAAAAVVLSGCAGMTPELPKTKARATVVSVAGAQIEAPYKYGGADRTGFDDSGLVYFAYREAGYEIPRYAEGQLRAGHPIRFAEAKPGDLLFYRLQEGHTNTGKSLHVGIYVGDGQMVHASLDRDEVALETVDNAYWFQRLVGVIQVLP